ncbi:MAG: tRNA (adenosine(37)-N6)-dimethylallyltransferase MiaA [Candidatus Margulisbacteria bacterium GWF2_35_9]|nr:MAG: tRNA (adenosine(37)-N6)-dimethylallyltransferase MiaA [Candidatus Margulisbacteria bacterium GWF2_35_9]
MLDKIPIIIGPTAVGKTKYAIDYAIKSGAEIISADSMQVYRFMNIGTAKPSIDQLKAVNHLLIDIVDPDESWNLNLFLKKTKALLSLNKNFIIVGGTGLYIRSLIYNFITPEIKSDEKIRDRYNQLANSGSATFLHDLLLERDPESADKINKNDRFRLIRALEVCDLTGKKASQVKSQDEAYAKNFKLICLYKDREKLYSDINMRVDHMILSGLFEEVSELLARGYSPELTSMQALGYKETVQFLNNKLTKEECIELIKKKTRNFAKRQLTWYRSFPDVEWVAV